MRECGRIDVSGLVQMNKMGDDALAALTMSLASGKDFQNSLEEIKSVLGVEHAIYHLAPTATPGMDIPFVRTTYRPDWVMRYIMANYMVTDPVMLRGLSDAMPFFWSDLPRDGAGVDAFFLDAEKHGVGNCGYTHPIADRGGKRAMFTVNATADPQAFKEWIGPLETSHPGHCADIAQAGPCGDGSERTGAAAQPPGNRVPELDGTGQGRHEYRRNPADLRAYGARLPQVRAHQAWLRHDRPGGVRGDTAQSHQAVIAERRLNDRFLPRSTARTHDHSC